MICKDIMAAELSPACRYRAVIAEAPETKAISSFEPKEVSRHIFNCAEHNLIANRHLVN
jgi:hypothetical protein